MDDRVLAMLGDCAAAERLTEAGVLLPCPLCGAELRNHPPSRIHFHEARGCLLDRVGIPMEKALDWNTRAPILTPTQLALLQIAEEPRVFEEAKSDG